MAFLIPSTKPTDPKAYNVGAAVGPLATNAAGDVKLVQYMLKHFYGPPAAALKVDGFIGPTTISWIKRFQEDSKKAGVNVLVDSRIDPARGQVSSISKTVYTILVLNRALRDKNPAAYAAVPQNVPMTATPPSFPAKPNPNNPAKPKILHVAVYTGINPPHDVYVFYANGTIEHWLVQGAVSFPPGTPVFYIPKV